MTNKKQNLLGYFILMIVITVIFLFRNIPNIVFYFDQQSTTANVLRVDGHDLGFSYFHEGTKEDVILSAKVRDRRRLDGIRKGDKIDLRYSKRYPFRVYVIGLTGKPWGGSLIIIIICVGAVIVFGMYPPID